MGRPLEALNPRTRWLGTEREILEVTESTNLVAEQRAGTGAPDGCVILADRQTAGRGRLGRSFHSPGGVGIYLSAILRPLGLAPEHAHRHVFAAAVAVAECARAIPGLEDDVEIKWPNDVLLGGLKTSGINLSVQLDPRGQVAWLVLGIGVNVNTPRESFPDEIRSIATSLAAASGRPIDRTRFAEVLLERLEPEIDALRAGGFARVLDRWREFFRMQGARVQVALGPGHEATPPVEGDVRGVDDEGALLLHTPEGGTRRVVAGDMTLLRRGV